MTATRLLRLTSDLDRMGVHDLADRMLRLAMPPYGYHRTDPSKVGPILSEGFHGDISPEYFEEHFDTFYGDLSDAGRKAVDEAAIAAGYDPDEVEFGFSGDRYGRRWDAVVEALMGAWYDDHPDDRLIWVSSDPLGTEFGDSALEVDLEGMPDFLNDYSYGLAHRYTLQPGEENIPASRFRHIPEEELEAHEDPSWWWNRAMIEGTARIASTMDGRGLHDLADRLDSMLRTAAKGTEKLVEYLRRGGVPDRIIDFVMSPGRRINPKMRKWLAFKLRDQMAPTIEGIQQGKYPETSLESALDTMTDDVAEMRDWFDVVSKTPGFDIYKYKTIEDAARASAEWHHKIAEEMEENGHPKLYKYPDYNAVDMGDGYRMVQINPNDPRQDLQNEGNLMGHCVGQGSYENPVREGSSEIWSLRDADGYPHVTIELVTPDPDEADFPYEVSDFYGDVHDYIEDADEENQDYYAQELYDEEFRRWRETAPKKVEQIQGKENEPPIDKYRPYIYRWLVDGRQSKKLTVDDDDLLTVTPSDELMRRIQENPNAAGDLMQYLGEDYIPVAVSFLMRPEVRSTMSPDAISSVMSKLREDPAFDQFVPELMERMQSGEEGWGPNEIDALMRSRGPAAAAFTQQMIQHADPRVRGKAYSNIMSQHVQDQGGAAIPFSQTPQGISFARDVLARETAYQPISDLLGMLRITGNPEGRLPNEITAMLPTVVARMEKQIREMSPEDAKRGEAGFMLPHVQSTAIELASKNAPHLVPRMVGMLSGRLQHRVGHSTGLSEALKSLRMYEPEIYTETLGEMGDDLKGKLRNPGFSSDPNASYNPQVAEDFKAMEAGQELGPVPDRWLNPKYKMIDPERLRPFDDALPRDLHPEMGEEEAELSAIREERRRAREQT